MRNYQFEVSPCSTDQFVFDYKANTGALRLPAGLSYVAESLDENGIGYKIIDTGLG